MTYISILSAPLKRVLFRYGKYIPANYKETRTDIVSCHGVVLIFGKVDDQVNVIPKVTGQCVTLENGISNSHTLKLLTQGLDAVDDHERSVELVLGVYPYCESGG